MVILFWIFLFGSVYSYLIYPIVLLGLPKRKSLRNKDETYLPNISLIITAHNEENSIKEKITNSLDLDYPAERLEIIVASDASTDNTDNIVLGFKDEGVKLVRPDKHLGKEYAQQQAIHQANGEIIVFSDAGTRIDSNAIRILVSSFTDPKIGAVSSVDKFMTEDGSIAGEGAYVKYEMWLRSLESRIYSLVGLSGSFFATRNSVCDKWDVHIPSDFNTALNCIRMNYVAISNENVIGYYKNIKSSKNEYARKYRTVIRGLAALFDKIEVLNPLKYGFFSFQIFSHKVMRWLVPWFLFSLLINTIFIYEQGLLYKLAFYAQFSFYITIISAGLVPALRNISIFKIPFYFAQVNLAIAHATIAFMFGKRITTWKPSQR